MWAVLNDVSDAWDVTGPLLGEQRQALADQRQRECPQDQQELAGRSVDLRERGQDDGDRQHPIRSSCSLDNTVALSRERTG